MMKDEFTGQDIARACEWHSVHIEHIRKMKLERTEIPAFPPSGSDILRPELWMDSHWKWFLTSENHATTERKPPR
jgi:hypothetical protein